MTTLIIVLVIFLVFISIQTNQEELKEELRKIRIALPKKEVKENIPCFHCNGEGSMYMENPHDKRLYWVEGTFEKGKGEAYCIACNGHGELTPEGEQLTPAAWEEGIYG